MERSLARIAADIATMAPLADHDELARRLSKAAEAARGPTTRRLTLRTFLAAITDVQSARNLPTGREPPGHCRAPGGRCPPPARVTAIIQEEHPTCACDCGACVLAKLAEEVRAHLQPHHPLLVARVIAPLFTPENANRGRVRLAELAREDVVEASRDLRDARHDLMDEARDRLEDDEAWRAQVTEDLEVTMLRLDNAVAALDRALAGLSDDERHAF